MAKQMGLGRLPMAGSGVIVRTGGDRAIRRSLLGMGMVTGATVPVKVVAPLCGPIELLIEGYCLSLREHGAQQVVMEVARGKQA